MTGFGTTFFFNDQQAASSGTHGAQSNEAAYELDWATNPAPESISQLTAPHAPQAQSQGPFDSLPVPNSGFPSFTTRGEPQGFGAQQTSCSDIWFNSDNLVNPYTLNTNTRDSGYQSTTLSLDNHQVLLPTHEYQDGTLHQHYLQRIMSTSSHTTEGSDASSMQHARRSSIVPRNPIAYEVVTHATKKRQRDHLSPGIVDPGSSPRFKKVPRVDEGAAEPQSYEYISVHSESALAKCQWMQHPVRSSSGSARDPKLDRKQKAFIRRWFKDFTDSQTILDLANSDLNALATLLKVPPQSVRGYVNRKCISLLSAGRQGGLPVRRQQPGTSRLPEHDSTYSLRDANQHLPPTTLQQVEKYVKAFGKRRQPGDGRRKVNTGPFKCTFKCGYRTKRPFDWRRHEETHEPQELWLCHLCSQDGDQNPFLVNRKDKLLHHAKDNHQVTDSDEVVEKSKVNFRPKPNTRCPLCPENLSSWDERCKHVISHYEDQMLAKSRRRPSARVPGQSTSDEDSSEHNESDTSRDSSDDEDDDPGSLQDRPHRGGPTGGAGGGSAGPDGPSPYKSNNDHQPGSGTSGGNESYGYPNIGYLPHTFAALSGTADLSIDLASREIVLLSKVDHAASPCSSVVLGRFKSSEEVKSLEEAKSSLTRSTNHPQEHSLTFLGRGSHGFVDTVQNHVTGRLYARKTSSHKSFPQEIEIIKRLSHPHVIQFISAYFQDGLPKLIMSPVAQSTLGDWLEGPRGDANNSSRVHTWIGCLSSALKHVHSEHIRHADVKPQNLLIRGSEIFITDFGISRVVSEADSSSSSVSPSTPLYAPIEIAEHDIHVHGRKADVFSLGCVVLEMLSYAQGKGVMDLHKHLGLSATNNKSPRDSVAYYKVRSKVSNWIATMREPATETTQALWRICEHMLDNDSSLRPSSAILLAEVRRALKDNDVACETCRNSPVEEHTYSAGFAAPFSTSLQRVGGNKEPASSKVGSHDLPRIVPTVTGLKKLPGGSRHKSSTITCICPAKETRSSALSGLFDILAEYEKGSFGETDIFGIANSFTCPPPAYHDLLLYPASISVTEATARDQPHEEAGYAAQMDLGKVGTQPVPKDGHEALFPTISAHGSCHGCSSKTNKGMRCQSLGRKNRLPRKANDELAAIGSHLHPPVYSCLDSGSNILANSSICSPLTELQTDTLTLNLVLTSSSTLGNIPGERFIEDCPSTFDRIYSPSRNSIIHHQSSTSSLTSAVDSHIYRWPSDTEPSSTSSLPLSSLASYKLQPSRTRSNNREPIRPSFRRNRQYISGRSKQSVRIRQQAMNDHNTTTLDSRDLTSRLNRIQKANSTGNDGDAVSRLPRMSRSGTTSSDTSSVLSRLPAFRKSQTSSTTSSDSVSRLEVMYTFPLSSTNRESVEVGQGEFSKPSVRRRRASNESTKSQKEFQYYGRHANSWLFNDFSVTDTVKKGWGKVFAKSDEEE